MNITLERLAPLPMRTWSWAHVNDTELQAEVPTLQPFVSLPQPALPAGIATLGSLPSGIDDIETGLGPAARDWVRQNANAGALLTAADGGSEAPLYYTYTLSAQNPTLIDSSVIVAQRGSQITVVQSFLQDDTANVFHAGLTRIVAEEGARVKLIQLQLLGSVATHLCDVGVTLAAGAQVEVVQIEFGAARLLAGCETMAGGQAADCRYACAYFGDAERRLDFNYVIRHNAPLVTSNIHAAGALFDSCIKNFRGTLDFISGAADSVGREAEQVLLFSPTARNLSTPIILCGEENVSGEHAASVGKIDADKLFYLESRGLSEQQAKRLLLEAQYAEVLDTLPDPELRQRADTFLAQRMQSL